MLPLGSGECWSNFLLLNRNGVPAEAGAPFALKREGFGKDSALREASMSDGNENRQKLPAMGRSQLTKEIKYGKLNVESSPSA